MRGLISLCVIAAMAYAAGRREGEAAGRADGWGKAAGIFTAGAIRGVETLFSSEVPK